MGNDLVGVARPRGSWDFVGRPSLKRNHLLYQAAAA